VYSRKEAGTAGCERHFLSRSIRLYRRPNSSPGTQGLVKLRRRRG
jgi:hypothetical protein